MYTHLLISHLSSLFSQDQKILKVLEDKTRSMQEKVHELEGLSAR